MRHSFKSNVVRLEQVDETWVALTADGRYLRLSKTAAELLREVIHPDEQARTASREALHAFVERFALPHGLLIREGELPPKRIRKASIAVHTPLLEGAALTRALGPLAKRLPPQVLDVLAVCSLAWLVYLVCLQRSMLDYASFVTPTLNDLVTVCVVLLVSVVVHELGHALICVRVSGGVGSFGVGVVQGLPVVVTDVSPCYFACKSDRIRVALAGSQLQTVFVAGVTVLVPQPDVQSRLAMLMILFICFTLLPFVRNDGFWIMADLRGDRDPFVASISRLKLRTASTADVFTVAFIGFLGLAFWSWVTGFCVVYGPRQLDALFSGSGPTQDTRLWIGAALVVLQYCALVASLPAFFSRLVEVSRAVRSLSRAGEARRQFT